MQRPSACERWQWQQSTPRTAHVAMAPGAACAIASPVMPEVSPVATALRKGTPAALNVVTTVSVANKSANGMTALPSGGTVASVGSTTT